MPKRMGRGIAAIALTFALLVPATLAEAQPQATKPGLGVSRQKAGAASGQSSTASSGTLSVGTLAAVTGLVVVVGIAVAVGSGDGASSASSTN